MSGRVFHPKTSCRRFFSIRCRLRRWIRFFFAKMLLDQQERNKKMSLFFVPRNPSFVATFCLDQDLFKPILCIKFVSLQAALLVPDIRKISDVAPPQGPIPERIEREKKTITWQDFKSQPLGCEIFCSAPHYGKFDQKVCKTHFYNCS